MNRLWVRFALVISGIVLIVVFLTFAVGIRFRPSPELTGELEALLQALPPDFQAELQMRIEEGMRLFLSRTLLLAAVVGTVGGIVLSRMLLAPLQDLAEGARAIAGRDLSYRVRPRGSAEVRAVAETFNQMAGELEQAESLRRQLLADVAHELRNPLHVLRGNLQAILDGVYPLNQEEMSRLLDQTDHLARLVNDLHELALAEARQLPLDRQPADLGALVKEAAGVFRPLAAAKQIELRVELLGPSPTVVVDVARIRQTLQNLLWNAVRHTPAGGHILVTVTRRGAAAEIIVRDDGEGIAAEHLPQVFDRFFRAGEARDREAGGAGLGLAIVKAVVEAHGGGVAVESAGRGRGSAFTVTLPE
ncbi:sensor histidine kinase [Promineifilum sp.]|uniref:sensor histidine kinase n=1 Tax=Promineifilum sp. TaxID=2664178 RepID=UPI0035B10D87